MFSKEGKLNLALKSRRNFFWA